MSTTAGAGGGAPAAGVPGGDAPGVPGGDAPGVPGGDAPGVAPGVAPGEAGALRAASAAAVLQSGVLQARQGVVGVHVVAIEGHVDAVKAICVVDP
jgi:hypothetical protein